MLIHYDKVGVLKPEYIDPDTKYRYYSIQQLKSLAMIKSLQAVGVSLGDIKEKYLNTNIEGYIKNLKREEKIIEDKFNEIQRAKKIIEDKLACLEEITDMGYDTEFKIKNFPLRHVVSSPVKNKTMEDLTPIIVDLNVMVDLEKKVLGRNFLVVGELAAIKKYPRNNLQDEEILLGIFSKTDISVEGPVKMKFEAGTYLCFYREGFFLEAEDSDIIEEWCRENDYDVEGSLLMMPVILPFLNMEKKLYQVQIKVKKIGG